MNRRYRPRRLLPRSRRCWRRGAAFALCACLLLSLIPVPALAVNRYGVSFTDYDGAPIPVSGTQSVPEGARLYTASELEQAGASVPPGAGCSWYLYYPGAPEEAPFGPLPIPDPVREGYTFRDWAAQGGGGDGIHTVAGDTVFTARYHSDSQYVLSLYYQFANQDSTVAAETTTIPFSWQEDFSIPLPDSPALAGLSPAILAGEGATEQAQQAAAALSALLQGGAFSGGMDDGFLSLCRAAGFVAWDEGAGDYLQDEDGNVHISIPVTYSVTGTVSFQVAYLLQDPEGEGYTWEGTATGSVQGTTRVSLDALGLTRRYPGFALTAASAEDADSCTVNADGSSTIQLYYDRNVRYIYYEMNGGNVKDPVPLRYGADIPAWAADGSGATRTGYRFAGYQWLDGQGQPLAEPPAQMPDQDLWLSARWQAADTTVTLAYWLENANDGGYTLAGQLTIPAVTGQSVGYDWGSGGVDVPVNAYTAASYMAQAGIPDGDYFSFSTSDSNNSGAEGFVLKTADAGGGTVVNLGFTRNRYTLMFHLGRVEGGLIRQYQVSTGGNSAPGAGLDDWQSGYSGWERVYNDATLEMGGGFSIDNDSCYTITAKYGAYISHLWPAPSDERIGSNRSYWNPLGRSYTLVTWGTHSASGYYQTHDNKNIMGVYATMSAELIIDPARPEQAHHLTGYWQESAPELTHHYMFEAVPGAPAEETVAFGDYAGHAADMAVQGRQEVTPAQDGNLRFYEYETAAVRTTNTPQNQNAPSFSNVIYQYGCHSGSDVYFFYTYTDYTLTYQENNPDLSSGAAAGTRTVSFHYVDGLPLAQLLQAGGVDYDYAPWPPYISSYGNAYTFSGWYQDADCTFPVDWDTLAADSNLNVYAGWTAPTFTITLRVPGGTLPPETVAELAETYSLSSAQGTVDGQPAVIYTVSGVPGGTRSDAVVEQFRGAVSDYSLAFDYWGYLVDGQEQRYLFDSSQRIVSDLELTARWKTEYTGQYTVRYLTDVRPDGWDSALGSVDIGGVPHYRLLPDETVTGVAVGSSVTVTAQAVDHYLSRSGQLTGPVAAPVQGQSATVFHFLYDRISAENVTYFVHYVRDVGVDYARGEPPGGAIRLAPDKEASVPSASLSLSTCVSEQAPVIPGYSPRDSWSATFPLSGNEAENHLYFYYVSNSYQFPFRVIYHFESREGYLPSDTLTLSGQEALGKVLYARDLAVRYRDYFTSPDLAPLLDELDARMVGHTPDWDISGSSLMIRNPDTAGGGGTVNDLHLYFKRGSYQLSYDLNPPQGAAWPPQWPQADSFLTPGADGQTYTQTVLYPDPAGLPSSGPQSVTHGFLSWNTAPDGTGADYPLSQLSGAPWYQEGGVYEDVRLYAQWEEKLTVSFLLRGGRWTDGDSGPFYPQGNGQYLTYAARGERASQPSDPVFDGGGAAYSFLGWSQTDPAQFTGENGRVDIVAFQSRYQFDFTLPLTQSTVLYAVWDPDVTTFAVHKTDAGAQPQPLAGAQFTLERLQASVTAAPEGGYDYQLTLDPETGQPVPDSSFPVRSLTTGADGLGLFSNLPAGYYRLTEASPPEGYAPAADSVLLYAPYAGQPGLVADVPGVSGEADGSRLDLTVENTPQYSVTLTAPSALTFSYYPPDLIWNPEKLQYQTLDGQSGSWSAQAQPEGSEPSITVSNHSLSPDPLQVEVELAYDGAYAYLLPLSALETPEGYVETGDGGSRVWSGALEQGGEAQFILRIQPLAPGQILPEEAVPAGVLTVRIRRGTRARRRKQVKHGGAGPV